MSVWTQWLAVIPTLPWVGGVAPDGMMPTRIAAVVPNQALARFGARLVAMLVWLLIRPSLASITTLCLRLAAPVVVAPTSQLFCLVTLLCTLGFAVLPLHENKQSN